jgi:hypothetical protein
MHYHPLIGIAIFILSVLLAFFFGKWAVRKGRERIEARRVLAARAPDAASPDAPWIEGDADGDGPRAG